MTRPKAIRKVCQDIVDLVGATIVETHALGIDVVVNTAVGPLTMTTHFEGWVSGRFSDNRAVLLGLGDVLNRHSLKYNLQGTTQHAQTNPERFKQLALKHINRATSAQMRDEKILLKAGPKTATDLPIIYEGSAAEWLAKPYDGPWQDVSAVKLLLLGFQSSYQQLIGDHCFVVQRVAK